MQYRRLGASGPMVSAIGLGCMGMSDGYGPPRLEDRAESIVCNRLLVNACRSLVGSHSLVRFPHFPLRNIERLCPSHEVPPIAG